MNCRSMRSTAACFLALWATGCTATPAMVATADQEPTLQMPIQARGVMAVDEPEDHDWNLRQIHQSGFHVQAAGGSRVVVAVLDTGADDTHPELASHLYNGKDLVGHDVYEVGGDRRDFTGIDGNGHGTHVTGIIADVTAGTNVRVLPVKVIPNTGVGDDRLLSAGIDAALAWRDPTDPNVRVRIMNLSVSSPKVSERLRKAIQRATDAGVLVVGASGNEGQGVDFPAIMPEVLTVGATTVDDRVADYSCHGDSVDVAAPGGSDEMPVYSTWPSYLTSTDLTSDVGQPHLHAGLVGTSMAAPHVSGLAGVLWSQHPGMTARQVRASLLTMSDDLGKAGPDDFFGFGRLNYPRALGGVRHDAH